MLNSSCIPSGAHTSTATQVDSVSLPSWRITLPSPGKHWSYVCNADTFSQVIGLWLLTTNFYWIWTSSAHQLYDSALLALIFLLDAYCLLALWLCCSGRWVHYIDDKGIWIRPTSRYGFQKQRCVLGFKLHTLTKIEDRPGATASIIRCHYTNGHTFAPNTFDLPYAAEDRDLVENVVLSFLKSKFAPEQAQPAVPARRIRRRTA